jgi:transglutaminase-like putative cysteine protease
MNSVGLRWTTFCAAALGLSALSLTGEIASAYVGAAWAAGLLGLALDARPAWQRPIRRVEPFAVIVMLAVAGFDFFLRHISFLLTVAHFLLLFQIFKLLGPKTRKDYLQIFMFSFFQLLSACTLSADLWQALALIAFIPVASAVLFWQQVSREEEGLQHLLPAEARRPYRSLTLWMSAFAIPANVFFAAVLFLIFPRLSLNARLPGLGGPRMGYTDQVNLTQTGSVQNDHSTVLWLQILPPERGRLWKGYLRGAALDYFDGQRWSRRTTAPSQTVRADINGIIRIGSRPTASQGNPLRQSITLINTAGATLFASPYPIQVRSPLASLQLDPDGSLHWLRAWDRPLRYEIISDPQAPAMPRSASADDLQLPNMDLQRIAQLAQTITAGRSRSPQVRARAIEMFLQTRYRYSLALGQTTTPNPLEDFLFKRQSGLCGHFASAMAVMLRLQGIPAHVVAGYLRGTWNPLAQQFLIRQSDAHAWVEAYIKGQGWVLYDPSPALPSASSSSRWLQKLQTYWDYTSLQWDQFVIEYNLYSQIKILQDLQLSANRFDVWWSGPLVRRLLHLYTWRNEKTFRTSQNNASSPHHGALLLSILFAALIALTLSPRRRSAQRSSNDRAIAFYQKFLQEMARRGFPKAPSETGWEFARRLAANSPQRFAALDPARIFQLTQRYYKVRFAAPRV